MRASRGRSSGRGAWTAGAALALACCGRSELAIGPELRDITDDGGAHALDGGAYALDSGADSSRSGSPDGASEAAAACTIDSAHHHPTAASCASGRWTFGPITSVATSEPPLYIATGDFDGNGALDLLAILRDAKSVAIWFNQGDGTFACPATFAVDAAPFVVAAADFDGDGLADFALGFADSLPLVEIFTNQGDGTFAITSSLAVHDGAWTFAVADFDDDGAPDLAISDGSEELVVALNRGDGVFPSAVTYQVGYFVEEMAAGDMNQDGALDIVSANAAFGAPSVGVVLNHGDGTFEQAVSYPGTCDDAGPVALGDFNGDGWPDVVRSCWQGANAVAVRMNDGYGTLGSETTYPIGTSAWSVLADRFLTTGGPLGVAAAMTLSAEYGGSGVGVLPGVGDGTFRTMVGAGSPTTRVILAGDYDGDGHPDIAFTSDSGVGVLSFVCE